MITLLQIESLPAATILAYGLVFLLALGIAYLVNRWIFAIDKRVNQNTSMIRLLTLIAKKHGATDDEIIAATKLSR